MSAATDVEAVLRHRARLLADPRRDSAQPGERFEVLLVDAGDDQRYALEARQVAQVQRNEHLRRVPAGAGSVLGVVPVRSGVVAVVDLAAVLGTGPADRARPFVVVLTGSDAPLGLLVDGVSDVRTWLGRDLRRAGGGTGATGASGTRVGPGNVVLLDVHTLLDEGMHR